jgi:DNA-binding transcriptional LysR family regulator
MSLPASFPELASLDLFTTVVEVGSVSRAAKAHGITQPSASSRLKHLERQLGLQLLERSPSGSRPTDAGVVVAEWAEAILRAAHELNAGLGAFRAEQTGRLRIAASFTIAEYLLPQWLDRFSRQHPKDSIALEVLNSTVVTERVRRGEADLGFIESPSAAAGLVSQTVGSDELVTVVAPGHPWSRRGSVPVEALAATPLVMREAGSGTRQALESALIELGLGPPTTVLELGSTSAVRTAVVHGNAPTVISRLAVAAEINSAQLVEIHIRGLRIERQLRAIWPEGSTLSSLARALLNDLSAETSRPARARQHS